MLSNCKFPSQRVSDAEKATPTWYQSCIDFVIQQGINCNDRTHTELQLSVLQGNIPDSYYKKTVDPYNANKEKYKKFPATMRNLDITRDIVRRYISEYIKDNHEFIVTAGNPELVLAKNAKIKTEVIALAQQAFVQEFKARLARAQQEAQANGTPPEEIDTNNLVNVEDFMAKFEEKYVDDVTLQGQNILDFIDSTTDSELIYVEAWKDFVTIGECYTYRDARDGVFVKEVVPILEAYPIPNGKTFVKNHNMFARRMELTYQDVIDTYDNFLSDIDREYLKSYYAARHGGPSSSPIILSDFYPGAFDKYGMDRDLVKNEAVKLQSVNPDKIEVWHVVWRGEQRRGILTYQNEAGFVDQMIVDDNFVFNKELGHIDIKWEYEPQVYEGIRIGTHYNGIYPMQCRPIAFNRKGELPYNGIMELMPYLGKFSIVDIVTPFQVIRNILSYHREMVIARNKLLTTIIPRSLMGASPEEQDEFMYRWAADGAIYYDDTEDPSGQRSQNIRGINLSLNNYISEITTLIESIKDEAREAVDMNAQRYGDIAQSAGKSTTNEAIARGSMGSVIVTFMFDKFREKDYNIDMDMSKLAFIDGLDTTFNDKDHNQRFISVDVNSHVFADYSVSAKNSAVESEKLKQLRNWAFSAAQNGDLDMALAAITGSNTVGIKRTIEKFGEIKRQHEQAIKDADERIAQMDLNGKLQAISLKGEEDRKTEELRYYYEMQMAANDTDIAANMQIPDSSSTDTAHINGQYKQAIEQDKNNIKRQELQFNIASTMLDKDIKRAELGVKMQEIKSKERIARTNKNKYDK